MGCLESSGRRVKERLTWTQLDVMTSPPTLTATDVRHVKEVWRLITAQNLGMEVGVHVFMQLFDKFPAALSFFGKFQESGQPLLDSNDDGEEGDDDDEEEYPAQVHINYVMRSLAYFIDKLDTPEEFLLRAKELQKFHRGLTGPAKPHFRFMLEEVDSLLVEQLGGQLYSEKLRESFYLFIQILYFHIARYLPHTV